MTVTWLKAMAIRTVDALDLLVTSDTNKRLVGLLLMVTLGRTLTQNWPMDQTVASSSIFMKAGNTSLEATRHER
jgi:hypothetical protein